MFTARAGNDHTRTINPTFVGRLQRNGHFCPRRKGRRAAKLNAAFVYKNRILRKEEMRFARLDSERLL